MDTLNKTFQLYHDRCDKEFLKIAPIVREHFRDKTYSLSQDGADMVSRSGTQTEYVFEAHERTYLSFLIASSYFRLGQIEDSKIELRRMRDEQNAQLYNYGQDPLNTVLQAVMWENLGEPDSARPFWKKIEESNVTKDSLKEFARVQQKRLDQHQKQEWDLNTLGGFPELEWNFSSKDLSKSYYQVKSIGSFADTCVDHHLLVVSSEPWLSEIQDRYDLSKHPQAYVGTVSRGVVGATFSGAVTLTGVGLGLGVCMVVHNADACSYALQIGAAIAIYGLQATGTYLSPDLRHIEYLPAGIAVGPKGSTPSASACLKDPTGQQWKSKSLQ